MLSAIDDRPDRLVHKHKLDGVAGYEFRAEAGQPTVRVMNPSETALQRTVWIERLAKLFERDQAILRAVKAARERSR